MFHWSVQLALVVLLCSISIFVLGFVFMLISNVRTNSRINQVKSTLFNMSANAFCVDRSPLRGKVAIVTGSTNGIGEQTAMELFSMGAHVIVASRTLSKCHDSVARIQAAHPRSTGKADAMQLDTSDFDNVRAFVKLFDSTVPKLHFLVNNAGIHYLSSPGCPLLNPSVVTVSKQGFDLAFATNYMGHWLLTDLLLPKMTATGAADNVPARVVNISSAYHLGVDGSMLLPTGATAPLAARTDIHTVLHRRRSYSNNKLAQVLHTYELDRRLRANNNRDVQVVSVCPGWVGGTGIVAETLAEKVIRNFGFELGASTMAPVGTLARSIIAMIAVCCVGSCIGICFCASCRSLTRCCLVFCLTLASCMIHCCRRMCECSPGGR
jgi:NAD(P)-dependent dehydrogenase (short-subunit alcohol dehydrogenase family)